MPPISMTFMVYQGGHPYLEPALESAIAWIESETEFAVRAEIAYSGLQPAISHIGDAYMLQPGDVDWSEIPEAQWVFLLWDCGSLHPCPWSAGGTWGLYDWRGTGRPFVIISLPYGVWWDNWVPWGGFDTWFGQVVVHEWKNGLVSWLNDGYGYSMLNTYSNGNYIDCGSYPEGTRYADCYRELLAQLTPEMYEDLTGEAPPLPPPGPPPTPIIGLALLGLALLGIVALSTFGTREEEI